MSGQRVSMARSPNYDDYTYRMFFRIAGLQSLWLNVQERRGFSLVTSYYTGKPMNK